MGTDYPFPLGELEVGKVVEEFPDLSSKEKDEILFKNAVSMLDLDEASLHASPFS